MVVEYDKPNHVTTDVLPNGWYLKAFYKSEKENFYSTSPLPQRVGKIVAKRNPAYAGGR